MHTFCFELGFISHPAHWVLGGDCVVMKIHMMLSLSLQGW